VKSDVSLAPAAGHVKIGSERNGMLKTITALILLLLGTAMARGQDTDAAQGAATTELAVVATRVLPPFIVKEGNDYSGFSAELWKELAARTGMAFVWKETNNVKELLAAVENGEAQIAIAAISITSDREQKFDFSQPMFESGLQVLVPADQDSSFSPLSILRYFSSGAMPYLLGILALLILLPGHLVWWAERKHAHSPFSKSYIPGIFQAMGWALSAAAGQQNDNPRSRIGRFYSISAILVSLLFLTYWQAELTSSFTVQQLQGGIQGPDDLPGKRVGTTASSTSAKWAAEKQAKVTEFQNIGEAFQALESGQLDAVVFDSPVLLYYAANGGAGKVRVVGPVFKKENYGIAFPRGSDAPRKINWRKRINESLLRMREDGAYDALHDRWFGQK
jgi:polar amino acid transport system substrate-binding protein